MQLDPSLARAVADIIREQVDTLRTTFAAERKELDAQLAELRAQLAIPVATARELEDVTTRLSTLESRESPKSLTLEDVAPLVTQAFEAYPKPQDGHDGKDADPLSIDEIQPIVDLAVSAAVEKAVEALPKPQDGKDAEVDFEHLAMDVLARIPVPSNGKDAEPVDIDSVIAQVVAKIPPPQDGKDGTSGRDGVDGKDGRDGVDGERGLDGASGADGAPGRDGIDGKDGRDGIDGKHGQDGTAGERGADGRDGIDGKSVTVEDIRGLLEGEYAKWALDVERRHTELIQRTLDRIPLPKAGADGKDGKDGRDGVDGVNGKDGRDGFGFDDMSFVHDGERTMKFKFARGEDVKEFTAKTPSPIYRGVWKAGAYETGDEVTWGGSLWLAQRDTSEKPQESDAWRLIVKCGRDGKDGAQGPRGEAGPKGRDGRDLTARGFDGSKF